jgi:hypothetical protein
MELTILVLCPLSTLTVTVYNNLKTGTYVTEFVHVQYKKLHRALSFNSVGIALTVFFTVFECSDIIQMLVTMKRSFF